MAKRSRSRTTALSVYRAPPVRIAAPQPIIVRQSAPMARTSKRRGKRRGGGGAAPSGTNVLIGVGIASAAVGFAEKSGLLANLPAIPLVGRKGLLAIAAWYYSKHGGGPLSRSVALAAAALSGYDLGKTGTISGDEDLG